MAMSSSFSFFMDKDSMPESHFTWSSLKKFVYMACNFSNCVYNFDIFSKIVTKVRIYEFVICEITIGMAYMFMDCFTKQYTRKLDAHKYLNPLLKGITYGLFMQTAFLTIMHANYLADSLRFLVSSFKEVPTWSVCKKTLDGTCMSTRDIILKCQENNITDISVSSAHLHYIKSFTHLDRYTLTLRFFVIGLVWIFNFFMSTVTDDNLLKIFKLVTIYRIYSTLITLLFVLITTNNVAISSFIELLDINYSEHHYTTAVNHVAYTYGIGLLGFYDFSNTSPYTMIDNAVIIYMLLFTTGAFLRSWIMRIMYVTLAKCVTMQISVTQHYYLFALLPLSTEFLRAPKLYTLYVYLNVIVSCIAYLTMLTLTMSKLLQTEFRSIKNIYIVGLLCCLGFSCSLPVAVSLASSSRVRGLMKGLKVIILYLGGFKVAIIMWIYGAQRFSTDIHFWLGFKPTKFWIVCWMVMPIVLSCFVVSKIYKLSQSTNDLSFIISAISWIVISVMVVAISHIKTIAKYLVLNNLAAAFSSSNKYGPPDPEDRIKRRCFNETIHLRQCTHNCHILDDTIDCNHLPLMRNTSTSSSEQSIKNIFERKSSRIRNSIVLDIDSHF